MLAQRRWILSSALSVTLFAAGCGSAPLQPPVASPVPSPAPSAAPGEVMTRWVEPASLATISVPHLTLTATAPASSIHEVSFHARAAGVENVLCVVDQPGPGDSWSCSADLVELRIPVGPVVVWFDTVNSVNTTSLDAGGRRSLTFAAAPPRPVVEGFENVKETTDEATETTTIRYRAGWSLPDGYATTIRVYGVTTCPREAAETDDQPCVLEDTSVPKTSLRLLAMLPGTSRATFITESQQGIGPGPYWAVIVVASNQFGDSPFGVLTSSNVCFQCVY